MPSIQLMVPPELPPGASPQRVADVDPLFSFLDWYEMDSKSSEEIHSSCLGGFASGDETENQPRENRASGWDSIPAMRDTQDSNENPCSRTVIHCARLSFYKSFNLLRVTFLVDHPQAESGLKFRRGYALYRLGESGCEIKPLNGTSIPIHEVNRARTTVSAEVSGELMLSDDAKDSQRAVDDYLRFFCSAVHGEDGPFLILDMSNCNVVLDDNAAVSEALKREFQLGIRSEADLEFKGEFAKLSNPFPDSSIQRRKACVAYSSALFWVWFAIDNSVQNPGMVQMLDDEPILTGLNLKMPRYKFTDKKSPAIPSDEELGVVHYHSRRGQSADEIVEVNEILARLSGREAPPDDTINVEVVFRNAKTKEKE